VSQSVAKILLYHLSFLFVVVVDVFSFVLSLSLKQSGELRCELSAARFFFLFCVCAEKNKKKIPQKKRVVWLKKISWVVL
jgi:hypothetical protein